MPDDAHSSQPLSGDKIASQVAALAAHLQLSGVQWLPAPDPETVKAWAAQLAVPEKGTTSQVTETAEPRDAPDIGGREHSRPAPVRPATRTAPVAAMTSSAGAYPGDVMAPDQRHDQLSQIQTEVANCTRCAVLASCRKQTVFGEGSPTARVVFFGEGPGADEDRTGRPFVGRAGQLLTKMIEACTFKREETYILNTVKCRPPGNRNPEPDEIENCRDYYQRQLAILRPEYIVCLGAVSAQELLKSKLSVGRLRGRLHAYFESKVLVTYHPAYLLRNPAAKKAAWADLQLMLKDAGIDV